MMKIVITDYKDHSEVWVMNGCQLLHSYTFDTSKEAKAFCSGFQCAKTVANSVVQSLPMGYERRDGVL